MNLRYTEFLFACHRPMPYCDDFGLDDWNIIQPSFFLTNYTNKLTTSSVENNHVTQEQLVND